MKLGKGLDLWRDNAKARYVWAAMLAGTFVAFIPIEEAQLLRARGEDYRSYMKQTRWRLFRGVW